MDKFELVSEFKPQGDQPQAIQTLVDGIKKGEKCQTLLGVTGSGKTFTMANVIAQVNKPTIVLAHNKTLAAQLAVNLKNFFQITVLNFSCRITIIINRRHIFRKPIRLSRKIH